MNRIFHCSLPQDLQPTKDEPTQVIVRFFHRTKMFGDKEDTEKLSDLLTMVYASHQGLSPKVYGAFKGGRIEQFIPVSTVSTNYSYYSGVNSQGSHSLS